ncbi:zinc finger protein 449-like [Engraulis encrasicolus]|uniref:zinc finger protein 449-like n=1 Tax=Engraulis encrasicolus TaxID=184585 RepID=UPI002FD6472C
MLVPYLTGRARAAYVILAKYEINAEVYRQRFRDPGIQSTETPREFHHRLKDLFQKWIKPERRTVEEIVDLLILEQFLRSLSPEVRTWVKEHDPRTGSRAAELVEAFLAARRGSQDFRFQHMRRPADGTAPGAGGSEAGSRRGEQWRDPSRAASPPLQRPSQPKKLNR